MLLDGGLLVWPTQRSGFLWVDLSLRQAFA